MVLAVVGNFDPDEAGAICDELLKPKDDPGISVLVPEEPPKCANNTYRRRFPAPFRSLPSG